MLRKNILIKPLQKQNSKEWLRMYFFINNNQNPIKFDSIFYYSIELHLNRACSRYFFNKNFTFLMNLRGRVRSKGTLNNRLQIKFCPNRERLVQNFAK